MEETSPDTVALGHTVRHLSVLDLTEELSSKTVNRHPVSQRAFKPALSSNGLSHSAVRGGNLCYAQCKFAGSHAFGFGESYIFLSASFPFWLGTEATVNLGLRRFSDLASETSQPSLGSVFTRSLIAFSSPGWLPGCCPLHVHLDLGAGSLRSLLASSGLWHFHSLLPHSDSEMVAVTQYSWDKDVGQQGQSEDKQVAPWAHCRRFGFCKWEWKSRKSAGFLFPQP